MDGITIRRAKREDCKGIRELIQELADFEKMPNGPKISHETLERDGFDVEHPLFICYVAVAEEKIVGYALFYYTYSTWCGKAMYLEDIYVTKAYRKKHVGSRLLKIVAKEAVENNCNRLDLMVLKWNPAREFYERKGAVDLTTELEWLSYRFPQKALVALAADS